MAGWQELLTEVLRHRRGRLVGYAHLFTADRAAAEDLVHDAIVRTFSRSRDLHDVPTAEAYLRRAIRTAFLDGARSGRRFTAVAPLLVDDAASGDIADRAAAGVDVTAALASLPPRQRACVVLRYYDDLALAEVATELGVSVGAVKRYLFDAVGQLRSTLGVDLPDLDDDHVTVRTVTPGRLS